MKSQNFNVVYHPLIILYCDIFPSAGAKDRMRLAQWI